MGAYVNKIPFPLGVNLLSFEFISYKFGVFDVKFAVKSFAHTYGNVIDI